MNDLGSAHEALKQAVDCAGGQAATARICGVSQPAVWKWLRAKKPLPAHLVLTMEAATGISRHALRPDIYPLPERAAPGSGDRQPFHFLPLAGDPVACDRTTQLQRKAVA